MDNGNNINNNNVEETSAELYAKSKECVLMAQEFVATGGLDTLDEKERHAFFRALCVILDDISLYEQRHEIDDNAGN